MPVRLFNPLPHVSGFEAAENAPLVLNLCYLSSDLISTILLMLTARTQSTMPFD
jgi:hypothetical protein